MPGSRVVLKDLTSACVKYMFSKPKFWYFWISISRTGDDVRLFSMSSISSYNISKKIVDYYIIKINNIYKLLKYILSSYHLYPL